MKQLFPDVSANLRLWWDNWRLWLWHHGGERIAGTALYLIGHGLHWKERHAWLNDHGPIQSLQRGMAVFALVIGFVYSVTGRGAAASPLADLLDEIPYPVILLPHQWFGLLLALSSALLLVAIYEWPVESEKIGKTEVAREITEKRLRSLLKMQLCGHMMAFVYWGLTGLLLLWACKTSAAGWGSLSFCAIHAHLYIRNNREYEKEKAEIKRAQVKVTNGHLAAARKSARNRLLIHH